MPPLLGRDARSVVRHANRYRVGRRAGAHLDATLAADRFLRVPHKRPRGDVQLRAVGGDRQGVGLAGP